VLPVDFDGGEHVYRVHPLNGFSQLKIVRGTLDAVKYRDDILDPIVLPFLQQQNFDHVFQHNKLNVPHACGTHDNVHR
jgi:hypothetical protein